MTPRDNTWISYVVYPPGKQLELSVEKETTIGRENSNHIVLPSNDVSRFHAKIRWEKQGFVIEDLRSSNGTILNEEYITVAELHHGDRIYIGTYELFYYEFRAKPAPEPEKDTASPKETIKITFQSFRETLRQSALQGDLRSLTLSTILQILSMESKSGCLNIYAPNENVYIYFQNGLVVHCDFGKRKGIAAFFAAMNLTEGTFNFSDNVQPTCSTMHNEVEFLLLEYARQTDEKKRT